MNLIQQATTKGLILDGAMSDELERQGVETNNTLWTASALINNLAAVYNAHKHYLQAGAQLIITNTYQANVQAFQKLGYTEQEATEYIAQAVIVAKKARDDYEEKTGQHNFVAGTIGSYGAYLADGSEYRGDYNLTVDQYLDFHLPRMTTILEQNPDCLAIETQPKLAEPVALLDWLQTNQPQMPVYVSFTLKDAQNLSDGTALVEAVAKINSYPQVFAVGINCVHPNLVSPAIEIIKNNTDKQIVIYPNQGSVYDPKSKTWQPITTQINFFEMAKKWYSEGAHLIGGCCTTGPAEIEQIKRLF